MKKIWIICSILATIIAFIFIGLFCYDQYQLNKTVEKTITTQNTNINIVVKTKYDDGDLRTTVKVENGWFKQWAYNLFLMTEPYDDFITVFYEDKDNNVIHKVQFALKDFVEVPEENIHIAKKTTEISAKKYRKIKNGSASYKGLQIKEITR